MKCSHSAPHPQATRGLCILAVLAFVQFGFPSPTAAQEPGWTTVAPMPTPRLGLAVCESGGLIYAIGGYAQAGAAGLTAVEAYDPALDSWSSKAPMPTGRRWLACGALDGKIYAMGGFVNEGQPALATVEVYDTSTDSWSTAAPMLTARKAPAAAAWNGKVYAMGGADPSETALASMEEYDPAANAWTAKPSMSNSRAMLAAAALDGKIYAAGGPWPGQLGVNTVESFDVAANTWTTSTPMLTSRWSLALTSMMGKLYAIGGADGTFGWDTAEEYDPTADSWTRIDPMPSATGSGSGARSGLGAASVSGALYVIGGTLSPPPPHPGVDHVQRFGTATASGFFEDGPGGSSGSDALNILRAYPNPFHRAFDLTYDLARPQLVRLKVVDVLGRKIAEIQQLGHAGSNEISFESSGLVRGAYLFILETAESGRPQLVVAMHR